MLTGHSAIKGAETFSAFSLVRPDASNLSTLRPLFDPHISTALRIFLSGMFTTKSSLALNNPWLKRFGPMPTPRYGGLKENTWHIARVMMLSFAPDTVARTTGNPENASCASSLVMDFFRMIPPRR